VCKYIAGGFADFVEHLGEFVGRCTNSVDFVPNCTNFADLIAIPQGPGKFAGTTDIREFATGTSHLQLRRLLVCYHYWTDHLAASTMFLAKNNKYLTRFITNNLPDFPLSSALPVLELHTFLSRFWTTLRRCLASSHMQMAPVPGRLDLN
jgi:hypothetical protein